MEYDDDDKYIGSSGDARFCDVDIEYDTDNICIDSSGDARCCVSTLSGCGGGMAERGVCMMCPNVITV